LRGAIAGADPASIAVRVSSGEKSTGDTRLATVLDRSQPLDDRLETRSRCAAAPQAGARSPSSGQPAW
jgi:hypothetical protein